MPSGCGTKNILVLTMSSGRLEFRQLDMASRSDHKDIWNASTACYTSMVSDHGTLASQVQVGTFGVIPNIRKPRLFCLSMFQIWTYVVLWRLGHFFPFARCWKFKAKSINYYQRKTNGESYLLYPIGSMYGIVTYICLIFMVNVAKHTIHGSYRIHT